MNKNNNRNGYKWSINEILQLQREYELLELSVSEMAKLHQRTDEAIVFKLLAEGFLDDLPVNRKRVVKRKESVCMKLRSGSYK